jgi:hypothetical protein
MSQNLITAGVIDPSQLPLDRLRKEVATLLKISVEWHQGWQQVLRYCVDCTTLEQLAPEIRRQSQEFADLPEVMQAMQKLWKERWQELNQASA